MSKTKERGEIYRDDHLVVWPHRGSRVAVAVGQDPDKATPTIVDGAKLQVALSRFLRSEQSDE